MFITLNYKVLIPLKHSLDQCFHWWDVVFIKSSEAQQPLREQKTTLTDWITSSDWICPGAVQLTCVGQSDISHVTMSYLSKLIILYWMLMDLRVFYCLMLNRTLVDWLHDTSYITSQDISLNFLNLLRFRTEHRSPWNPCPGPQVYNTQCLYCFVRFRSNHDVKNRYFYSSIQCELWHSIKWFSVGHLYFEIVIYSCYLLSPVGS